MQSEDPETHTPRPQLMGPYRGQQLVGTEDSSVSTPSPRACPICLAAAFVSNKSQMETFYICWEILLCHLAKNDSIYLTCGGWGRRIFIFLFFALLEFFFLNSETMGQEKNMQLTTGSLLGTCQKSRSWTKARRGGGTASGTGAQRLKV